MKTFIAFCFILFFTITMTLHAQQPTDGPLQQVSSGKVVRITQMPSVYCEPRNVDIWLPEHYDGTKPFAVLYMHDGQMLFDATTTWNKQAWEVDSVAADLMKRTITQDFIVVGAWNAGAQRHPNYFPQKVYENLADADRDYVTQKLRKANRSEGSFEPNSDDYLKFLVHELKPHIDSTFNVYTDVEHTFVAGSSMGGLISWYALCEYPNIFGGAACLSTHWPGIFEVENNPLPDAFIEYLEAHLPSVGSHKIYFDTGDKTLDALYPPIQKEVDQMMLRLGYTEQLWQSKYFPGADHSELSWQKRLGIPFRFLLGTN
jgi:enterochelin esterase-like enzyme